MSDIFPVIPSVDDIVRAVIDAIRPLIGDLLDRPLDTIDNVVDNISGTVNNAINRAANSVDNAIGVAGKVTQSAIDNATSVANNAVNRAANAVDNSIASAKSVADNAVNRAADAVNRATDAAANSTNKAIDAASRSVNNAIDTADRGVTNAINAGRSVADNAVNSARQVSLTAIDVADRRIGQTVNAAKEAVIAVAGDVQRGLENAGKAIERAVGNTVNAASDFVNRQIGAARDAVDKTLGGVSRFIDGTVKQARDSLGDLGRRISDGITSTIANLTAQYDALMHSIAVWWQQTKQYIADLIDRANHYITERFSTAWAYVTEQFDAYNKHLTDNLNRLESGVEAIGGKLFSCGYDNYGAVISDIAGLGIDASLVRVILLGILGAGVVIAGAPTAAQPYLQCIANIGLKEVRPMSADLGTLADVFTRGLPSGGGFGEAAARQGIPESMAQAYIESSRNPLPIGSVIEALLRGIIDETTATSHLVDNKLDTGLLSLLVENARPLLAAGDAYTAARRGGMTLDAAESEAIRAGYSEEKRVAIRRLTDQLLTSEQYVTLWLREEIDENTLNSLLYERGYITREQDYIKRLAYFVPPPSDLITMSLKDVWNEEIVKTFGLEEDYPAEFEKYAGYQGISPFWAKKYWATAWSYPSNTQGFEMYQRGFISESELQLLLKTNDVPPFWRERLIKLNYNPLTRVDIRRMYQLGILDEASVTKSYLDIGYSPDNAKALTEFTKRYTASLEESDQDKTRALTLSQIQQAYTRAFITKDDAIDSLIALKYTQEDAALLLTLAESRTLSTFGADTTEQQRKRLIRVVVGSYTDKTLDIETAGIMLTDLGLSDGEALSELRLADQETQINSQGILIDKFRDLYIKRILQTSDIVSMLNALGYSQQSQDGLFAEWGIDRELREGRPARTDLRRWFRQGVIDADTYAEELRGLGYAEKYIGIFVSEDMPG